MSYDIYGNNLRPGYCEVHPDNPEPYPCSICQIEVEQAEMLRREEEAYYAAMEEQRMNEEREQDAQRERDEELARARDEQEGGDPTQT